MPLIRNRRAGVVGMLEAASLPVPEDVATDRDISGVPGRNTPVGPWLIKSREP
ncbi:hypothetical protein [Streptomyces sp. NBC_00572]|uniref:hypothetical protein n=1 Tax=Streptomyces sp. NBC_00572 TaxID=2903664 RepID=UPI002257BF5B|nr:hypothetical protein [Streptomyces sp. NBC_00572]MCX4983206.1 hypothetical protein [Streptomyces sp. NBC_00572]